MSESTQRPPSLQPGPGGRGAHYLLVAAVAAVVVFWNLGGATLEDHEAKLSLAAAGMAEADEDRWLYPGATEAGIAYRLPPKTPLNRWTVPVENGRPRLVKTPLPYWVAAVLSWPAGGVGQFSARLGSAVAAVALALLTLALGRRLFSARAALYGALMFAVCVGFQKWGRDARPEMMLCLWMAASMVCFLRWTTASSARQRWGWGAAFWLCMGLANLSKQFVPFFLAWPIAAYWIWWRSAGRDSDAEALARLRRFLLATAAGLALHVTTTMIPALRWWQWLGVGDGRGAYLTLAVLLGLPMAGYFLVTRAAGQAVLGEARTVRARRFLWSEVLRPGAVLSLQNAPGLALCLAMFVPWMLYMTELFPDLAAGVFSHQVSERGAAVGEWSYESPVKYFQGLLTLTLPWVGFLPGAFAVGLMARFERRRRGLVFCLLWCVGLLVLFSAAAVKREHYILPMIPAMCLLMGFVAEEVFFGHKWIRPRLSRLLGVCYGLAAPVGVLVTGVLAALAWAHWRATPPQARWAGDLWRWPILAGVVAVASVPAVLAASKAWRWKFSAVVPLTVASVAIVYVGYWTFFPVFDPRATVADFATEARQRVGDQAVAHWGDPQAKTAYYFGRTVPALHWPFQRQRFQAGLPIEQVQDLASLNRQVVRWLQAHPDRRPWVMGYLAVRGRAVRVDNDDPASPAVAAVLESLGYELVLTDRGVQEKRHVFALWRPGQLPSRKGAFSP